MTNMEKRTISLPAELDAFAQGKVDAGLAPSKSAYIAGLLQQEADRDHDFALLRTHYGSSMDSDEWHTAVSQAEHSFGLPQSESSRQAS